MFLGEEGLEPSKPFGPRILSPLRLPVPPLALVPFFDILPNPGNRRSEVPEKGP